MISTLFVFFQNNDWAGFAQVEKWKAVLWAATIPLQFFKKIFSFKSYFYEPELKRPMFMLNNL